MARAAYTAQRIKCILVIIFYAMRTEAQHHAAYTWWCVLHVNMCIVVFCTTHAMKPGHAHVLGTQCAWYSHALGELR